MLKTIMNSLIVNSFINFWTRYDFEDTVFANFGATKEPEPLEIKSEKINIYRNKTKNLVFVEAFGRNSFFLKSLIYSLNSFYSSEEKSQQRFYIFTDNSEFIDHSSLFFIIPTERKNFYKKIKELKEQIMPEPKQSFISSYICIKKPEKEDDGLIEKVSLTKKLENWFYKILKT
ncbi:MAG: hypothetical protein N3G19_00735 [Candidatus Pacearchaeota archaeon]|nr:hypothetical protein [Candidatus Pacearchaeota archaeon]